MENSKSQALRELLTGNKLARVVGTGDAIGAMLAERHGLDAVWASGLCISAANGLPDAGILTMTELLTIARVIDRSTSLPIIADCDTGFGDVDNIIHMIREYDRAGIAGVCIEDKPFPKTNSFLVPRNWSQLTISLTK